MADMFTSTDAEKLLKNKNIVFIGGSNVRAMYKDLVWFLQNNSLVPQELLRKKLEESHVGDLKVKGSRLHKGRHYVEDRSFHYEKEAYSILVEYIFTSSCYSQNVVEIFNEIEAGDFAPDLIIMNSTLWDVNRWGPKGIDLYKENMVKLMELVSRTLPSKSIFLWLTAPPVSSKIRSSLLIQDIQFLQPCVRFNILEANNYARQIVGSYGYDVLDLHYYCRMQLFYMIEDGIHFEPLLVRYMTNLVLTHCSLSWNERLPGNVCTWSLGKTKQLAFIKDSFTDYINVEDIKKKIQTSAPPSKEQASVKPYNVSTQNQINDHNTAPKKRVSTKPAPAKKAPLKSIFSKLKLMKPAFKRSASKPVHSVSNNVSRQTQSSHPPWRPLVSRLNNMRQDQRQFNKNSVPWLPLVSWQNSQKQNQPSRPRHFAPGGNNFKWVNPRFQKPSMPFGGKS